MSDIAIQCEGLSKRYHRGTRLPYHRLTETLTSLASEPLRWFKRDQKPGATPESDGFWALKDVSFEVKRGEVLGVIGRNGAGKSTLLKVLSRITEPTSGRARITGRVGSLLEVGTGFHPELTGRENIYLNGAILGMTQAEIRKRFDAIVDFSETAAFLDTPVKHYSSGMYMRLAFAVAAHLDPEILIVDEVLAVGDAPFQKKCLGRMSQIAKEGRTILFVSHNMGAIASLCTHAIVMNRGAVTFQGVASDAVRLYLAESADNVGVEWHGALGDDSLKVERTWVKSLDEQGGFGTSSPIEVGIEGRVLAPVEGLVMGFTLWSEHQYELAYVLADDREPPPAPTVPPGPFSHRFVIPGDSLSQGSYRIEFDVGLHMRHKYDVMDASLAFRLESVRGLGSRFPTPDVRGRSGLFRPAWAVTPRT